ncbi:hypothetical protein P4H61_02425 [Paenibacillus peoriae]|uniref:DUF6933 domain-containing protein n=1 Tax=Paenibacillus peoriae TaxID=59893 RepID=UPI00026C6103|nr:hypothetical protein [Paenibacillus peoriae]MEC0180356.1 hypothetical protein [Paenibacillus peoriae]
MFVIRGTQKLLKEWDTEPLHVDIYPPLNSWHASLFLLNRRKNIVFMHDATRFSITLFGIKKSQYKNLPTLFIQTLKEFMISEGFDEQIVEAYTQEGEQMLATTTNSHSVMRTLEELIFVMKELDMEHGCELEKNQCNNRIVFKTVQYQYPVDTFKEALEKHYNLERV